MNAFSSILRILTLIIPNRKGLILFGSFSAERYGDNSAVLYTYILNNHPEYTVVWMTNNNRVVSEINQLGGAVCKRRTFQGIWLSLRAEVVISSHGIKDALMYEPIFYQPKLIYLGHGIPLKKGWIGIENSNRRLKKASHKKIKYSTYMISSSEFSAQLQNSFLPIGRDKIRVTGLPRNDILFKLNITSIKKKYALNKFKFVILYAPTFRNWGITHFFPFEDYSINEINKFCEINNVGIILRPHHTELKNLHKTFSSSIKKSSYIRIITHEDCSNVNELLVTSDCLITDYSSIFFDYLLLNNPMIFIPYDIERYEKQHGFIVDYDSVTPGYKPANQEDFLINLAQIIKGEDKFRAKRIELRDQIHKYQDANSCLRVTNLIKGLVK